MKLVAALSAIYRDCLSIHVASVGIYISPAWLGSVLAHKNLLWTQETKTHWFVFLFFSLHKPPPRFLFSPWTVGIHLNTCLTLSVTNSHIKKYDPSSLPLILLSNLPHHVFLSFYFCLSLSASLFPQHQMCSISTQKRFPHPGYNKQLFAVWNNKDCHHGYSSIPWLLSGPFRVLKGAIIWWHQRQVTT